MSTIDWSTDRSGLFVGPGTYGAADGRLVHCRWRAIDEIVCEVEGRHRSAGRILRPRVGLMQHE